MRLQKITVLPSQGVAFQTSERDLSYTEFFLFQKSKQKEKEEIIKTLTKITGINRTALCLHFASESEFKDAFSNLNIEMQLSQTKDNDFQCKSNLHDIADPKPTTYH